MSVLGGFVVGALGAVVAWRLLEATFAQPLFARTNVRGVSVPVGAGVIVALVAVGADALAAVAGAVADREVDPSLAVVTKAALAFGLLGLFDDLAGDAGDRGFAGHLRAARSGRLTTGGLKLFGGGVAALGLAASVARGVDAMVLVDGALLALAANLGNLFDRAPGRVTKVALVAGAVLAVATGLDDRLLGTAVVLGAAAGLVVPDLRERLMLGDAGANVVGAALGLGVVLTGSTLTRALVVVALAAANLASERVSFSAVIARTPVLARLDRIGRLPSG